MRSSSQAHLALRVIATPAVPVRDCPRNEVCGMTLPKLLADSPTWEPEIDRAIHQSPLWSPRIIPV